MLPYLHFGSSHDLRHCEASLTVPDSSLGDFESLGGDLWSWYPPDGRSIKVQGRGQGAPRTYQLPGWYLVGMSLRRRPGRNKVAVLGWNAATFDSLGLDIFSPADGKFTPWAVWFSEGGRADWLSDGSGGVSLNQTQRITTFYRVTDPGRVERVGSIPRQIQSGGTFSADFKRIAVVTGERRGDVWMSAVVRP
jgi:hypothetical protein